MREKVEIPEFPGYQIDRSGAVFGKTGKQMKARRLRDGYLYVSIRRNGKAFTRAVHRLVLLSFVGPCPKQNEARNLNSNKADNQLSNLAWGTKKENYFDQVSNGESHRKKGSLLGAVKHPCGRWQATFRKKYLGLFDTPELANQAFMEALEKYKRGEA